MQGEPGIIPDCPNITNTLTKHAETLVNAGVDFVVTDSTNLDTKSNQSEVIQVLHP